MGCSSPLFIIFITYPPEQETCGPGSYLLTVESSCFEIMSILISLGDRELLFSIVMFSQLRVAALK